MSWGQWFNENAMAIGAVVLFVIVLLGLAFLLKGIIGPYSQGSYSLSALALSGVIVLLGALLVFTTLVRAIGLSDPNQALGLPEGSVRALLALALLGLFAILVSSVLNPRPELRKFSGLREGDVTALIKNNPDARDNRFSPDISGGVLFRPTTGRLREADVDTRGYVDGFGDFLLFRDNISKSTCTWGQRQ